MQQDGGVRTVAVAIGGRLRAYTLQARPSLAGGKRGVAADGSESRED
jgi:hypothetical protein